MGNTVIKRRQKRFTIKNGIMYGILFLGFISIFVTIFYTIPQLTEYITHRWYISPLASTFSGYQREKNGITQVLLKQKLKTAGFQIKKIDEQEDDDIVFLESGEKVIISKKKILDSQISSLQLISSRFTIEGKHFVSLDLRFDRPVLVSK